MATPPQYTTDPAQLELVQKINAEYEKQLKTAESALSSRQKLILQLEAEEKKLQDIKRVNDDIEDRIKKQTIAATGLNTSFQNYQALLTEIINAEAAYDTSKNAADKARLQALQELKKQIDQNIQAEQEGVKKQMELEEKLHKAREEDIKKQAEGFKKLGDLAFKAANSLLDGFNFPLIGVKIKGLRELVTDVIKGPAEAFKQFGFLDQFENQIAGMRQEMLGAGIGEKEMRIALGDLNQTVGDFAGYSKGMQNALVESSAKLALAGFNSKTTATSFNNLVKVFGQTATQANATNLRLAALSKTLGDGNKTFEDFAGLTPKLTGFGSKAVDVFEKTAIAAKKLGIDAKELFGIMDQYDTFENAANAAGELNAALGGQFVDSLELMKASLEGGPVAVLNLLQKSFKDSGIQVENLSRTQLKYFAGVAKIPEDQFKKIFAAGGEGVEDYIKKQEKAAKEQESLNNIAKRTQDVFQQIQNAFAAAFADKKNIDSLVKVVQIIQKAAFFLADMFKTVKNLVPIMGGLFAAGAVLSFVSAVRAANGVMAALRATTIGQAIAQAFATSLTGVGWGVVAAAVVAAGGTAYALSKLTGGDEGEGQATVGAVSSAVPGGVGSATPSAPPSPAIQQNDASFSVMSTNNGRQTNVVGSADDTAILARPGGILDQKLDIIIGIMRESADKPLVVNLDGRKVNKELAESNRTSPFIA